MPLSWNYQTTELRLRSSAPHSASACGKNCGPNRPARSREIPGILPVNPEGGKIARAAAVSPLIEAGNVYLPHPLYGAG